VRGGRRVVAGRIRERATHPCWRIAWRRAGRDLAAGGGGGFRILAAPAGEHRADPFLLADAGRHHLFFERVPAGAAKGVIAHAELHPDGTTSEPATILEHETHLSYPFVFRRDGVAYMIPETRGRGRIELYRAERVPDRWVLERVLVDGVRAVDATLLEDGGRLWLFASVAERRERISSQLSLFSADDLDGEWQPHPANPVVRDVTRARPAGRIVRRGGAVIRPGQDCSGRYGAAIALNRIDVLSADRYAETTIRRLRPSRRLASHTWDADGAFEVVDVMVRGR
jgi:hypothetical protein